VPGVGVQEHCIADGGKRADVVLGDRPVVEPDVEDDDVERVAALEEAAHGVRAGDEPGRRPGGRQQRADPGDQQGVVVDHTHRDSSGRFIHDLRPLRDHCS
jgi:hypothetical protein